MPNEREQELLKQIAEQKALDSLARYKFQMFGYWAGIWVHLNRIEGKKRPNPFKDQVLSARVRDAIDDARSREEAAFRNDPSHRDEQTPEEKYYEEYVAMCGRHEINPLSFADCVRVAKMMGEI